MNKLFKILNYVAMVVFVMAAVPACLFLEVKTNILIGFVLMVITFLIAGFLNDREDHGWFVPFLCLGGLLYLSQFFMTGFWRVHVFHNDGMRIEVGTGYNNVWGKSLAVGEKIDTLLLATCYSATGASKVCEGEYYLLTQADSGFVFLNQHDIICEGYSPKFFKRDFGKGELHLLTYRDKSGQKTVDMMGRTVDSKYKPYEIDNTPDCICSPWI